MNTNTLRHIKIAASALAVGAAIAAGGSGVAFAEPSDSAGHDSSSSSSDSNGSSDSPRSKSAAADPDEADSAAKQPTAKESPAKESAAKDSATKDSVDEDSAPKGSANQAEPTTDSESETEQPTAEPAPVQSTDPSTATTGSPESEPAPQSVADPVGHSTETGGSVVPVQPDPTTDADPSAPPVATPADPGPQDTATEVAAEPAAPVPFLPQIDPVGPPAVTTPSDSTEPDLAAAADDRASDPATPVDRPELDPSGVFLPGELDLPNYAWTDPDADGGTAFERSESGVTYTNTTDHDQLVVTNGSVAGEEAGPATASRLVHPGDSVAVTPDSADDGAADELKVDVYAARDAAGGVVLEAAFRATAQLGDPQGVVPIYADPRMLRRSDDDIPPVGTAFVATGSSDPTSERIAPAASRSVAAADTGGPETVLRAGAVPGYVVSVLDRPDGTVIVFSSGYSSEPLATGPVSYVTFLRPDGTATTTGPIRDRYRVSSSFLFDDTIKVAPDGTVVFVREDYGPTPQAWTSYVNFVAPDGTVRTSSPIPNGAGGSLTLTPDGTAVVLAIRYEDAVDTEQGGPVFYSKVEDVYYYVTPNGSVRPVAVPGSMPGELGAPPVVTGDGTVVMLTTEFTGDADTWRSYVNFVAPDDAVTTTRSIPGAPAREVTVAPNGTLVVETILFDATGGRTVYLSTVAPDRTVTTSDPIPGGPVGEVVVTPAGVVALATVRYDDAAGTWTTYLTAIGANGSETRQIPGPPDGGLILTPTGRLILATTEPAAQGPLVHLAIVGPNGDISVQTIPGYGNSNTMVGSRTVAVTPDGTIAVAIGTYPIADQPTTLLMILTEDGTPAITRTIPGDTLGILMPAAGLSPDNTLRILTSAFDAETGSNWIYATVISPDDPAGTAVAVLGSPRHAFATSDGGVIVVTDEYDYRTGNYQFLAGVAPGENGGVTALGSSQLQFFSAGQRIFAIAITDNGTDILEIVSAAAADNDSPVVDPPDGGGTAPPVVTPGIPGSKPDAPDRRHRRDQTLSLFSTLFSIAGSEKPGSNWSKAATGLTALQLINQLRHGDYEGFVLTGATTVVGTSLDTQFQAWRAARIFDPETLAKLGKEVGSKAGVLFTVATVVYDQLGRELARTDWSLDGLLMAGNYVWNDPLGALYTAATAPVTYVEHVIEDQIAPVVEEVADTAIEVGDLLAEGAAATWDNILHGKLLS
ncbi:hypothetical protein [Skermania piniformis]|uniref:Uncharacterized protein n=1 Tax=Skermania pinensis TaxID=39122 RepID=A0ABX8S7P8_9ACTN|nr:hypothetical protein [Skermania piniformis]QXQ13878.1 hypothetical protein KV203_19255 [Skermania piniformis]